MSEETVDSSLEAEGMFEQQLAKVAALETDGVLPFGERFDGAEEIATVRARFVEDCEDEQPATIAGRLVSFRDMGGTIFADVKDSTTRIQIFVGKKLLEADDFKRFKTFNTGDIVGLSGIMFLTKKGELTLKVKEYSLLSKSLRPLPEKHHGLKDIQQRYRQRYLDLIMNDESKDVFKKRFQVIREIRTYLEKIGYIEVETPMLQPIAGGAAANPFVTQYDALGQEMYMRIAPELYLKRLLVGGFEKVFELNRNFRNEGMSTRHNPEFTMIEIYEAYSDCNGMAELIEDMVTTVAMNVFGTLKIEHNNGTVIDLTRPWVKKPYKELIEEKMGSDWYTLSRKEQQDKVTALGLHVDDEMADYEVTHEVYEKEIEKTLIQPTFVTRLPEQLVPLAKKCADDPTLVDVFELEINGIEIAPGYSELNDPIEQRKRFMEQIELDCEEKFVEEGNIDEDFLTAMEHGMPPAGGMGIGIDRLVMMLTGAESIRDVVLFPQMRLKK